MGRRSLYTEDRLSRFDDALKLGASLQTACGYAGFSYSTFRSWMRDATERGAESKYQELPERVAKADAMGCMRLLTRIEKAAEGDWRAAAWKLERRHPDQYGRRVVELSGTTEVHHMGEVSIVLTELDKRLEAMSDEELEILADG